MQFRPMGAELYPADGQTDRQADMVMLVVDFVILGTRLKYSSGQAPHSIWSCGPVLTKPQITLLRKCPSISVTRLLAFPQSAVIQ